MTTPEAPVRFCPLCKTADDHPRHDFYGINPALAPHFDCCAAAGCPDGSCPIIVEAKGDAVGAEFRKMLVALPDKVTKKLDARDDATRRFTLADLVHLDPNAASTPQIELEGVSQ